MNIKNNQRFQEVRKKYKALAELLKTEKVHNITVQDICNMSGVNRTTFYAHFSDIRELTERSEMQIREAAMMGVPKRLFGATAKSEMAALFPPLYEEAHELLSFIFSMS